MALVAQRLPVGAIPEERHVALVRDDVIDVGCCDQIAELIVLCAQRMRSKEACSSTLPAWAVASTGCRSAP
jgi:hypothetical protein